MSTTMTASQKLSAQDLFAARDDVVGWLLAERNQQGHWVGELSSSALATATAISAVARYCQTVEKPKESISELKRFIGKGIDWLASRQNADGGWGDTPSSHSNIATSMLVIAAIRLAGREDDLQDALGRANRYIDQKGSVRGLRERYGRDKTFAVPILANAAIAGMVPWSEVAALPFEAAIFPQRMYHWLQLPVVSYAIPALVAVGQVKFAMDPPGNPLTRGLRRLAISPGLRVLERMQPASGGYLEAIPLTSFVVMSLCHAGRSDHAVVSNGIRFLLETARDDEDTVTWPIDTNLATWNTTLSVNALTDLSDDLPIQNTDGEPVAADVQQVNEVLQGDLLQWLLSCQTSKRHPFTGAHPGGWGWSDLSGSVPDADDTPGALLALRRWWEQSPAADPSVTQIRHAAEMGIKWLLRLQNRDRGWPTFCRGWGRLPFDRSGSDITAHVVRALHVWKDTIPHLECDQAIGRGFQYLLRVQREDGSWEPLWFGNQDHAQELNLVYGTTKVLMAFQDCGRADTQAAKRGLSWLLGAQNADGGFGGGTSYGCNLRSDRERQEPRSSIQETALALDVMLGRIDDPEVQQASDRALVWLIDAIRQNRGLESWPIGFYFAKLWYYERLYPLIYSASALRRAAHNMSSVADGGKSRPAAVTN